MMPGAHSDRQAMLRQIGRRLSGFGALGPTDLIRMEDIGGATTVFRRGADITSVASEGPQFVLDGWACQMRPHLTRGRQIFGFLMPGDVIGSFWRPPEFTFYKTVALTALTVLSAEALMPVSQDGVGHDALLDAARRAEDHAQHRLFDHIVRLGARDAYSGLAHLLLEFHARLDAVGLADDREFILPIGQRVLAQAMGFSLAHTNHTLQRMATDGLLSILGGRVRLLQQERLAALADLAEAPQAQALLITPNLKPIKHIQFHPTLHGA